VPAAIYGGAVLAWVGTLIALLLWEGAVSSLLCSSRGGCETVLGSVYSEIRGVPLPVIGLVFYLIQLGLWLAVLGISSQMWRLRFVDGILGLAIVGVTFSTGLMYVQFGVLHAFCPLCTGSALTTGGLVIAAHRSRRGLLVGTAGATPPGAIVLGAFALLSLSAYWMTYLAVGNTPGGARLMELSPGHRIGPAEAPVQLSVFSDYQCGFCGQLAPVLKRVAGDFPEGVAITYRHFPLASHPRAYAAAVAAECAAEQGAFVEYSEKLHSQGGALEESDFISLAAATGLDRERFAACLHSARPGKSVDANLRDAARLGLESVPAVFLNGRLMRGPLTYENLTRQIRASLEKLPRKK